jgi:DNA-binding response OmpR family regulator
LVFGESRSATAANIAWTRVSRLAQTNNPMAVATQTAGRPAGPARVLALLDRPLLVALVKLTLSHCACAIRATATAAESATLLTEWQPHLAILDMDLDGRRVMEQIRDTTDRTRLAVIGLTRRGDLKTKLAALEWGADDTLTIPFALEELLTRVIRLLRRSYSDALTFTPVIRLGELEIDILNSTVRAGTSQQQLTPLEQSLLYLLAANAGRVVTREEILDTLWGADYVAESSVVNRHVRSLRAKLQNDRRLPRFIVTEPGRGYMFIPGSDKRYRRTSRE